MTIRSFPAVAAVTATCLLSLSSTFAEEGKATHDESTTACIGATKELRFKSLRWIATTPAGGLVACDGGANKAHVFTPEGALSKTIDLSVAPSVVCMLNADTMCVAGKGKIVIAGLDGTIAKSATAAEAGLPEGATPAGIGASGNDIFIAYCRIPGKTVSGAIYRLDANLTKAKEISTGHRGCCGNLGIDAHDGKVYVAENASHRVAVLDRDGKLVKRWGEKSRTSLEGFSTCCNPMALCVDKDGTVYTSESGPNRIKRYTSDGKFLGLVGTLGKPVQGAGKKMAASCSNTAVAVNSDGSRVYVIDEENDLIRVLLAK